MFREYTYEETLPSGKRIIFRGAATALVTPFRDGAVDIDCMKTLVRRQVDAGISALVSTGTTGESATLTHDEVLVVTEAVVEEADGRVPVIACVGGNDTSKCVMLAKETSALGADAVMAVTPYYNKTTKEGLYAHFSAIADASPAPLLVYNVPARTAMSIPVDVYQRLALHPNIVGVKEASADLALAADIISACGDSLALYSGCDELTLPTLALGGFGVISVTSNLFPREVGAMCRAWSAGDTSYARQMQKILHPVTRALFSKPNPIPVKAACGLCMLCSPDVRLPLVRDTDTDALRDVIETAKASFSANA